MKRCNASTSTDGHGGSAKINPPGVRRVNSHEVRRRAEKVNLEVKRDGRMWLWWSRSEFQWVTGYQTNYMMCQWLDGFASGQK